MTESNSDAPKFTPPPNNPWKGLRGVMAGTLILEAIVIALAFPIVAKVGGGLTIASGTYLGVLVALLVLGSGIQGRSWALPFNLALQVVAIAGFAVHWAIGAVGICFACVWLYIVYVRRDVMRRMERGELPGQEPIE